MKKQYGRIVVPVMLGVLCAAPVAFAQEPGETTVTKDYTENTTVTLNDSVSTSVTRASSNQTFLQIDGSVAVHGDFEVESSISALIDNKQMNHGNSVGNALNTNSAGTRDDNTVLENAAGNIGLNMASGDNNLQDNAAALAAADSGFVFDSADATVVVNQDTVGNWVENHGNTNEAGLGGSTLMGATGNIAVNIAAGDSNLQKNNLSATAAAAEIGTAAVTVMQQADGNQTMNMGHYDRLVDRIGITLRGGVSQSGTASISGQADQVGNVYPDIWEGEFHPGGGVIGHMDLDTGAGGAQDPNGDGGALLFNVDGELSDLAMAGSFSGQIINVKWVAAPTTNTARLAGSVLSGASGNIGVNVAAGTNNLQSNSLSIIANNID